MAGAASTTGASHLILQLGELGLLDARASRQVHREVERNLAKKIPGALPAFKLLANAAVQWVEDPSPEEVAARKGEADAKDLPILVAAIREGCGSLLTFNVRLYRPKGQWPRVEKPGGFVVRLREHLTTLAR